MSVRLSTRQDTSFKNLVLWGTGRIEGKERALYTIEPGSIPSTTYGPQASP